VVRNIQNEPLCFHLHRKSRGRANVDWYEKIKDKNEVKSKCHETKGDKGGRKEAWGLGTDVLTQTLSCWTGQEF
jgi:hypothetical protein